MNCPECGHPMEMEDEDGYDWVCPECGEIVWVEEEWS